MLLTQALVRGGGLVVRGEIDHHLIDDAVRAGRLVRVLPRVYADVAIADDPLTLRRAALKSVPLGGLSHGTALDAYGLPVASPLPIHVTTAAAVHHIHQRTLRVHRREGFRPSAPFCVLRDGVPVVQLDQALVESWPLWTGPEQRAPAIAAVRERMTTAVRLRTKVPPNLRGRRELLALLDQLAGGLHSELELWGHAHVFDHPSLPPARTQHPLRVGGRTFYLDRAYLDEMVAVELDGRAYHSAPDARERDIRRDADVARTGWLTLRFSHARLTQQADRVRAELREVLATRRQQLG